MTELQSESIRIRRSRNAAWIVGLIAMILALTAYSAQPQAFLASYLVAFMLCLGLTLGAAGLWMIHNLVGGGWGELLHRTLRAASMLVPLMLLLFIPIALSLETLYPWAREAVLLENEHIAHKTWYLNKRDFLIRSAIFFILWGVFAALLQRAAPTEEGQAKLRKVSAAGIVAYGMAITFAVFDWVMSLEPLFYSTIFGLIVLVGQLGSVFALGILITALWPKTLFRDMIPQQSIHDLGNFLLMSVMLWAYTSFSQLILIWSGQLPEEIMFYNYRFSGGWEAVGIALVVLHFALPFFILLFRRVKRKVLALSGVAVLFLLVRWLDLVWMVQPNFSPMQISLPWLMFILPLALGGLWLGSFLFNFERIGHG